MDKKIAKKKKTKGAWQKYVGMACFLLLGAACGVMIAQYLDTALEAEESLSRTLFSVAGMLVVVYIAIMVQTIIHEAGHMVFGMLTGYQFCSFRIFSFMWVKEHDKLRFRRLTIAGTGGQCLMAPPDIKDEKVKKNEKDGSFPVILYNLGGSFMNLFSGLVFIGLYFIFGKMTFFSVTMWIFAAVGFVFAVVNGIPMRMGTVDNDGYNMLTLIRSVEARYSFWVQMKVNEQISKGVRIKDMPKEWFLVPSDEEMKNSMAAVRGVFACNRLMDEQRFEEADRLMEHLLDIESGIVDLHRYMLVSDRMYVELIGQNRREIIEGMQTKEQKKLMKAMKNFPSILRTEYAYALLALRDDAKADRIWASFEKCARTYPYPVEIRSERELMEIAKERYVLQVESAMC